MTTLYDDLELVMPTAWEDDIEIIHFVQQLNQLSKRTGGGAIDNVATNTSAITSNSSTITSLSDTIEELEELIILLQKRIKTTVSMLEQKIKCLEEKLETD